VQAGLDPDGAWFAVLAKKGKGETVTVRPPYPLLPLVPPFHPSTSREPLVDGGAHRGE
jgi:hypothetical protein